MPNPAGAPRHLGTMMHHSKTCELVLKADGFAEPGRKVFDSNMEEIGYVSNIFGPVQSPFIAVKTTRRLDHYPGEELYILE